MEKAKPTRRQFLRTTLMGMAAAGIGTGSYSWLVEPNEITVEQREFRIAGLHDAFDGFRIALLSDFHFGPFTGEREIGAAVRQANALAPDIVVLTGDFITTQSGSEPAARRRAAAHAAECARVLSGLRSPLGVYACLGNHDAKRDADVVVDALASHRIPVLRNANSAIERDRARLWIAGMDDLIYGRPDIAKALTAIPPGEPAILIVHEPDFADVSARYPVALQLSGHSHGGQVRFPLAGALYLPPMAKKYPFGEYRVRNMYLYTNRGIGTILLPIRFNAPPEVTEITLRRAH